MHKELQIKMKAVGSRYSEATIVTNYPCKLVVSLKLFYLIIRTRCYIVTRCTNLVSVHYFLPLGI